MSWSDFLLLLAGPAAVGMLWSILVEYIPGFDGLSPKWKRVVFFGVCLLLPLVAAAAGVLTGVYAPTWDAFWQAIVAGATSFSAGTLMHVRKLPDAPSSNSG